jgi:uncharacterized phiE125 gp8 family phage protein
MMKLITSPSFLPLTQAEAKDHLRVDGDHEDPQIEAMIAAAVDRLDGWTGTLGRALMPQEWEIALDRFPDRKIRLPLGPVSAVTSVAFTGPDGAEGTVDTGDYHVDTYATEAWIVPHAGLTWPATMRTVNAVKVRWTAGTGCPESIKNTIKLIVGDSYQNPRGGRRDADRPGRARSVDVVLMANIDHPLRRMLRRSAAATYCGVSDRKSMPWWPTTPCPRRGCSGASGYGTAATSTRRLMICRSPTGPTNGTGHEAGAAGISGRIGLL